MEEKLAKAKELAKHYFAPLWKKDKRVKKLGFLIEALYGKPNWILKDLNEQQLDNFIERTEGRIIAAKQHAEHEAKLIQVCDQCRRASCWYGEFMCERSKNAGTVYLPISELRKLKLESSWFWSDTKLTEVYGTENSEVMVNAKTDAA